MNETSMTAVGAFDGEIVEELTNEPSARMIRFDRVHAIIDIQLMISFLTCHVNLQNDILGIPS